MNLSSNLHFDCSIRDYLGLLQGIEIDAMNILICWI